MKQGKRTAYNLICVFVFLQIEEGFFENITFEKSWVSYGRECYYFLGGK